MHFPCNSIFDFRLYQLELNSSCLIRGIAFSRVNFVKSSPYLKSPDNKRNNRTSHMGLSVALKHAWEGIRAQKNSGKLSVLIIF